MAMKLYNDTDIQDIADAIRAKNGLSATYKVSEMAAAISAIPTGGSIKAEFVTVTVPSAQTSVYSILTGNQFLADHYADNGAFVFLVALDNISATNSILVNMASNIQYGLGFYGFTTRSNGSALATIQAARSLASKDAVYNGAMYYENGALKVYATSTRILQAGDYAIIMGVIE